MAQVFLGSTIACLSGIGMYYNFKGLLSTGDNLARSSRISETASETMESGKGCKGSTNAVEPPSAYGKGHDIETNAFGPDTIINRNANYGAKAADPSYGVSNKPIGSYELEINTPSRSSYVTGTSRTGMAAGAEENIWLKAGNGTGVSGTPGRKVPGSLGSTGLDVGKPKVPDVPEIAGKGTTNNINRFIRGELSFDDVLDDYARIYAKQVHSNRMWSWNKAIPGGGAFDGDQRALIKQQAVNLGLIPNVEVVKVEGMRYGFADFASAGVVRETVYLPEEMWKMTDKKQFQWLDEQIGGGVEGYTWHHTEIPGKMELVPTGIHNIVNHNGGRTSGMWSDAPRQ